MAGGHELTTKVGKEFIPLIMKRRFKDALKAVPKQNQAAFIEHFTKWKHDNVASPDAVVNETFIATKYNSIPMEPPKPLGMAGFLTFPKNSVTFRTEQMIHLEKVQQQNWAWMERDHVNPYEQNKYYKASRPMNEILMYAVLFLVPFFVITSVFNKTDFYKKHFEGGIFDQRRAPYQKKPWDSLVQNEAGEWVQK